MINELSIKCFLTLCETLNFTETARVLYMTQQSVSKYIAKLEEDLGFRPATPLREGLRRFARWYKEFYL